MLLDATTVACITGGGDGIGLALAKVLASKGVALALVDVRASALEAAQRELETITKSSKVSTHVLDVRDREAIPVVVQDMLAAHGGRLSVLINSAGVFGGPSLDKLEYADFDRVLGVNLGGTVNMCRELFPALQKEQEAYIVNLSSLDGLVAMPGALSYVTSKFAVTGFTQALAYDLATLAPHVHVASVHPGFVSTDIILNNAQHIRTDTLPTPADSPFEITPEFIHSFQKRMASTTPAQAAEQIVQGMQANLCKIMVGTDTKLMDLLVVRLLPSWVLAGRPLLFSALLGLVLVLVRLVGRRTLFAAVVYAWWTRSRK